MMKNRQEAGKLLADELLVYAKSKDAIVLAIPRGGVVVGREIADVLDLPLSAVVVKKLAAPDNPELAIGAVAAGNVKKVDWELAFRLQVNQEYLDEELRRRGKDVEERLAKYKLSESELRFLLQTKKVIIVVDDGVATGATVKAAVAYVRKLTSSKKDTVIILAVPVIAKDTYDEVQSQVNRIIAIEIPESFRAVGQFYQEFPQVMDEEVNALLSYRKQELKN